MIKAAYVIMTAWNNPRHLIIVWNTDKKQVQYAFRDELFPEDISYDDNVEESMEAVLRKIVGGNHYKGWKLNSLAWAEKKIEKNLFVSTTFNEEKSPTT